MMRILIFFVFLCSLKTTAQQNRNLEYLSAASSEQKVSSAFETAEFYLENNDMNRSQKWLEKAKEAFPVQRIDETACAIHSLQSELFYYMGLFQFGAHEAEKGIQKGKIIKDSLSIADAYFFLGTNNFEMQNFGESEHAFQMAKKYFPKKQSKQMRTTIQEEHIYNNISQLKLKINQTDSAIWYNAQAYKLAKQARSRRGIPNTEQTFGEIFLKRNQPDSAAVYFKQSSTSAARSNYSDIILLNYAFLMKCAGDDKPEVERLFNEGLQVMKKDMVNAVYERYFYWYALEAFLEIGDAKNALDVQSKIIKIDEQTRLQGNAFLQEISDQYVKNENKLLSLKVEELHKQTIFQLVGALLCMLILILIVINIRRKNKMQQILLSQKNEISKDLHDDIGSGLSSILIHADLLAKSNPDSEKQQLLATKIENTGKEISQRLNTFIWSLSNEHNTLQSFCEYVKLYADTLLEGTQIQFKFSQNFEAFSQKTLNGHLRKNLFFCIKEILNNALKHSGADSITMKFLVVERGQIQIEIRDNGSGITAENQFGNGLTNIRKRIESMNGKLTLNGDDGMNIRIEVPF